MRIVVIGSGGTGGYYGAKLAHAGEDVTFVARGRQLAAIRQNGLRVRSAVDGEWTVRCPVFETLEGQLAADLVLFCVKSFDTESAAALLEPVIGSDTGILSLQNGVDNEDKLSRLYGSDHVMGGVSYVFSNIEAPGVIAHQQHTRVVFGEFDGRTSPRASALLSACKRADIDGEISADVRKALWEKYALLTAFAGTTAVTRLPVKFVRETVETRRLWELQLDELMALAAAEGINLDAGFKDRCVNFLNSLAPANTSSLHQDLKQGKRIELDALHGHAIRLGQRHRIPTPMLFAVDAALRPHLNGTPTT